MSESRSFINQKSSFILSLSFPKRDVVFLLYVSEWGTIFYGNFPSKLTYKKDRVCTSGGSIPVKNFAM